MKITGYINKKKSGVSPKALCFNCRKCFHRNIPHCVECQGTVHMVGHFFTAPKKNNIKEWKLIEKMVVQLRYGFSKYGASGIMPHSVLEADTLILQKIHSLEPKLYKSKKQKDINGKLQPLY